MSAAQWDQLAAGITGAGVGALLMLSLALVVFSHYYQGAHAARQEAARDTARCRQYHRLSPEERRIWRRRGCATPDASGSAAGPPRDATGGWRPARA